jgi:hypothetical protein
LRGPLLCTTRGPVPGLGLVSSCGRHSENGAGDGIRTRDIDLGKVALYQLSYSRFGGVTGLIVALLAMPCQMDFDTHQDRLDVLETQLK